MRSHRSTSTRRLGVALAAVALGCRPAPRPSPTGASADAPLPPPGRPCERDAAAGDAGLVVYRFPGGGTCQVLLVGDQQTLAPFVPHVVRAFAGFEGKRHLTVVMPNLRSLAGIEKMPPLDALELREASISDLGAFVRGGRAVPAVARLKDLSGVRLADITGLRALTSLESLELSVTREVRDLRALRGLTQLRWLSVDGIVDPDLSPLADLTALTHLSVSPPEGAQGRMSLRPLAGLRQLVHLDVHGQECEDLGTLGALELLETLVIRVGDDLGPIPDLPRLTDLALSSESLASVEPLRRARRLESLDLDLPAKLPPLTPLAEVSTLRRLDVRWRSVSEQRTLHALHALRPELGGRSLPPENREAHIFKSPMDGTRTVNLEGDHESLAPLIPFVARSLEGFTGHRSLYIKLPRLRSLAGIEDMPPFDEVAIHHTPLADLSALTRGARPVPAVAGVRSFRLTHSSIADISGLRALTALERVELRDNPRLRDVGALSRLPRLQDLDLSRTELADLSALAGLTSLTVLHVSWQSREYESGVSLRPLARLHNLTRLWLDDRECIDLDALRGLRELKYLHVTVGDDLGPIPDIPRLTELSIDSETLTSVAPLRRARQLEVLSLSVKQPVPLTPLADLLTLRDLSVWSWDSHEYMEVERTKLNQLRPDLIRLP